MILYDFIVEHILPLFVDISAIDGGMVFFNHAFLTALSLVLAHFLIVVPYRGILHLLQYRKWRK